MNVLLTLSLEELPQLDVDGRYPINNGFVVNLLGVHGEPKRGMGCLHVARVDRANESCVRVAPQRIAEKQRQLRVPVMDTVRQLKKWFRLHKGKY